MFLAFDENGLRAGPSPRGRAACPQCGAVVIAKCGRVYAHHWAHEAGADCDTWSEGMTQWHLDWQDCWPERQRELVIGKHRADIFTWLGESMPGLVRRGAWGYLGGGRVGMKAGSPLIVEIQHSYLSVDEIAEREVYYGKTAQMIWVWDCRKPFDDNRLYLGGDRGNNTSFTWKHARLTQASCSYPVFLDPGNGYLLLVIKWPAVEYESKEYYVKDGRGETATGWDKRRGAGLCRLVSRKEFVQSLQFPGGMRA